MNTEDARKLCDVFVTADGGCGSCIKGVCSYASKIFPEYKWESVRLPDGERVKVTHKDGVHTGREYYEVLNEFQDKFWEKL